MAELFAVIFSSRDINTLHYDPAQESHKQFELPEKEKEISKNKER